MKIGIFVHPKRPKVPADQIAKRIESAGVTLSQHDADLAVVVGGDGTFSYYGRTLSVPLLFVGVRDKAIIGSKARLAEGYYDEIPLVLHKIKTGAFVVAEKKLLSVDLNDQHLADILTDVYLERGKLAGCLRYSTRVKPSRQGKFIPFTDYAIGNGIIISTSFGSGGYYSYPSRIAKPALNMTFASDRIGICHIIPTYLARKKEGRNTSNGKVWYTVPFQSMIETQLMRDANARLYGTTINSKGVPVRQKDVVRIGPSRRVAKIIELER